MNFANSDYNYSGSFDIQIIGTLNFCLRSKIIKEQKIFLRAQIINEMSLLLITIEKIERNNEAYMIQNCLKDFNISFFQFSKDYKNFVLANESIPYAWEFPDKNKEISIEIIPHNKDFYLDCPLIKINLDKVRNKNFFFKKQ